MRIGHIDLSVHISTAQEQLVVLVEALTAHGVEQHVLVRNPFLAKRLAVCTEVSVGPIVRSPVTAFCVMPDVDIVHAHDRKAISSGLLLRLTRSIPFVLTHRQCSTPGNNPITRFKYGRAAGIVCPSADISKAMSEYVDNKPVDTIGNACNADNVIDSTDGHLSAARMAAEYLRVYRRTLDDRSVPVILLCIMLGST